MSKAILSNQGGNFSQGSLGAHAGAQQRLILWKESRLLVPLWAILMSVFLLVTYVASTMYTPGPTNSFFQINIVSCCAFALVAGICMFVYERENKTDRFLSALPVRGATVFRTKFLTGLVATIAFMAVAGAATWLTTSQINVGVFFHNNRIEYMISNILLPIECFVISVLMSVLFRRIIVAIVAAAIAIFAIVILSTLVASAAFDTVGNEASTITMMVATRLVGLFITAGSAYYFGRSWLRGRGIQSYLPNEMTQSKKSFGSLNATESPTLRSYSSLFWQSIRQQAVFYCLAHTLLLLGLLLEIIDGNEIFHIVTLGVFFLLGVCTFSPDQYQNRFRFFQHHGVRPRRLWLARILTTTIFATFSIAAWHIFLATNWNSIRAIPSSGTIDANKVLAAFLCLSIGQFFSMHIRSIVIAILFGGITCFVTMIWFVQIYQLDLNPWIAIFPLVIGFFLATWLKAKNWIAESRLVRSNLLSTSVVFFALCLTLAGIGCTRWNIPAANGPSMSEFVSNHRQLVAGQSIDNIESTSQKAARLYLKALASFSPRGDASAEEFVATNEETLDLVLEAAEHSFCFPFLDPESKREREQSLTDLLDLAKTAAENHTQKGELDRALGYHIAVLQLSQHRPLSSVEYDIRPLLKWSQHPDQTAKLTRSAIKYLDRPVLKMWGELVKPETTNGSAPSYPVSSLPLSVHYTKLDWENSSQREKFNVEQNLEISIDFFYNFEWIKWERERRRSIFYNSIDNIDYSKLYNGDSRNLVAFANSPSPVTEPLLSMIQSRRYLFVRLHLELYRLEHDKYPRSLESMFRTFVPNRYELHEGDIYTGGDFVYEPEGTSRDAVWGFQMSSTHNWQHEFKTQTVRGHIPKDTPFLLPWSKIPDSSNAFFYLPEDAPNAKPRMGIDYSPANGKSNWNFDFHLKPTSAKKPNERNK